MAKVRNPTTFLTQAELNRMAEEKAEQASCLPAGERKNQLLASANMYRRLGDLRSHLNELKPTSLASNVEYRALKQQ